MSPHQFKVLTPEQAQHFVEKGYVRVPGCLDPTWRAAGRLRLTPGSATTRTIARPGPRILSGWTATTWRPSRTFRRAAGAPCATSPAAKTASITGSWRSSRSISPRSIRPSGRTPSSSIFAVAPTSRGRKPSPEAGGWHKDGSFFRHFLDSREQGLLTIVYWSDVAPQRWRHLHCAGLDRRRRTLSRRPSRGRRSEL